MKPLDIDPCVWLFWSNCYLVALLLIKYGPMKGHVSIFSPCCVNISLTYFFKVTTNYKTVLLRYTLCWSILTYRFMTDPSFIRQISSCICLYWCSVFHCAVSHMIWVPSRLSHSGFGLIFLSFTFIQKLVLFTANLIIKVIAKVSVYNRLIHGWITFYRHVNIWYF